MSFAAVVRGIGFSGAFLLVVPGTPAGSIATAATGPVHQPARTVTLAPPSDGPRADVRTLVEQVTAAQGRRYGVRDSAGRSMDTAKIIQDPAGGYLTVYHTTFGDGPHVAVATSGDLLNWTFQRELAGLASQPTIAAAPDGGFVVAWEQEPDNHLAFRYFRNRADLLAGRPARSVDAPRTLSTCAEGTPNIYAVTLSPDVDHSTIDVGAHYFQNCDHDRQQRGTLTDFKTWQTNAQPTFDDALLYWRVGGNIGDRDAFHFRSFPYGLIEGQYTKGDFASWRCFVYDYQTGNADPLTIRTDGGSTAFANPSATVLKGPGGQDAMVVSLFIPHEGSAPGEAGQLIYYRML
jgi:hypothetical protein